MNKDNPNPYFSFALVLFNAVMLTVDGFATAAYATGNCPRAAVASLCFVALNFACLLVGAMGLLKLSLDGEAKGRAFPPCEPNGVDWCMKSAPSTGIKKEEV